MGISGHGTAFLENCSYYYDFTTTYISCRDGIVSAHWGNWHWVLDRKAALEGQQACLCFVAWEGWMV